jgi:ATP-dependent Clp protease adaptor protein ClpS
MSGTETIRRPEEKVKPERPKLWKVILLNDDFTPREFVTKVLMALFRMSEAEAMNVMLTAHQKGACVVAVFTKEVADEKARIGTEAGARAGYPLTFTTEREE